MKPKIHTISVTDSKDIYYLSLFTLKSLYFVGDN
jgi:hypothetical protein